MFNINLTEEQRVQKSAVAIMAKGPQEVGRHGWRPDARRT
jgi:hypothetical protein